MKILIVEDEVKTGDYIRQGFMESGFVVDLARTGLDGHHLAITGSYNLIVLDVMLPDVDGWRIMQSLREASIHHACVISHRKGQCRRPGQGSGNWERTTIWSSLGNLWVQIFLLCALRVVNLQIRLNFKCSKVRLA